MKEAHDLDLQGFETELRRIQPAPAPDQLVNRLLSNRPVKSVAPSRIQPAQPNFSWLQPLGWLIPAVAVGLVLFFCILHSQTPGTKHPSTTELAPTTLASTTPPTGQPDGKVAQGDELEIGQTWIATYDAVAELPNGEPVRFRCREWSDTTVFRDKARGIAVERSTPRIEIIPIRFETY